MSIFIRERQMGCWRSLGIQLIAALFVVPLFCVFVLLPLGFVSRNDASIWYLILPMGLFLLILFGGGFGWAAWVIVRRTRRLDELFVPLGLQGSLYQMFFRQYHGTIEGREVSVYLSRGPMLEIELSTTLKTRLGVTGMDGDTLLAARILNREPLTLSDPALDGLTVFAADETWARRLLDRSGIAGILQRLVHFEGLFLRRQILLMPGWLRLSLRGNRNLFRFDVAAEQLQRWLDDLMTLVREAEAMPAPEVVEVESSAERTARSLRNRNPYLVPLITAGIVVLLLVCSILFSVGFVWLVSTQ